MLRMTGLSGFSSRNFLPSDIAGLICWLDPSNAATITIGTGVQQINDLSTSGHHFSQSTGSRQPSLVTNAQNGLSTLQFVSANTQYFNVIAGGWITIPDAYSLFWISKGTPCNGFSSGGTSSYGPYWTTNGIIRISNAGGNITTTGNYSSSAYNAYAATLTGSTGQIYRDGSALPMNAYSSGARQNNFNYFGSFGNGAACANCNFGEVLLYNTVLTDGDFASVNLYLKSKWATP